DAGHRDYYPRRWAKALLLEAHGRPHEAFCLLYGAWEDGLRSMCPGGLNFLVPDLVRLAVTVGDVERANTAATATERDSDQQAAVARRAVADLCGGVVSGDRQRLRRAAGDYQRAHRPLFRGVALESLAVAAA